MKISQIGEFGLIELLASHTSAGVKRKNPASRQLIAGIGDDAAVWHTAIPYQIATVDSLIENVHFTLKTITWEELGWKSLAVNLSDIAAMGGVPLYALISLGLPPSTDVENVMHLYRGMEGISRKFGVIIAGGDTVSSPFLFISVTVIGSAVNGEGRVLRRSAARHGDKIAVTGALGASAGGLRMLTGNLKFNRKDTALLRKAHHLPSPRVPEGQKLVRCGVKCGMDISDGLIGDLTHICESSRVGARLHIETVPVAPVLRTCFPEKALELAMTGGEDYELLFTAPQKTIEAVQKTLKLPVTVVGEITAANSGKVILTDINGKRVNLNKTGWDHFQTK